MSTRKIATSTLWQIGSQVVNVFLAILTVKFVAIALSKELAGNYNSAYGYLQLFGILTDFGLYAVAVRELSRSDDKGSILGNLLILRLGILVMSFAVAISIAWLLPMWRGTPLPLGITIAALVPVFTLSAGMLRTVFQVYYKMHLVFIAEIMQRVTAAVLIGWIVWTGVRGSNDLHVYHLLLFYGGIGAFVLFAILSVASLWFVRVHMRFRKQEILRYIRACAPYGIAFLCIALYRQFDLTLIAILRPDYELQNAYYGFVLRMADTAFLLPTLLLNSVLPVLNERDEKGDDVRKLAGGTLAATLILGSLMALGAAIWARPLMQLLTTDAYLSTTTRAGSDTALRLIALPMFCNAVISYGFYMLLTKHRWQPLISTLVMGVAFSFAMNILMIPRFGFTGAAFTSVVVHILLATLLLPRALKILPVTLPRFFLLKWATLVVVTTGALFAGLPLLTSSFSTLVGMVAIGFVMAGLVFGLKILDFRRELH